MNAYDDQGVLALLARRYGEHSDWSLNDFMYEHGSAHSAILYLPLFVPRFVEVEGAVFFRDVLPEGSELEELQRNIRAYRSHSPGRLKSYVDSYNWFELRYQFADRLAKSDEYHALAELLVDAWAARLKYQYPQRRFRVRVMDAKETGSDVGVGFEEVLPSPIQ